MVDDVLVTGHSDSDPDVIEITGQWIKLFLYRERVLSPLRSLTWTDSEQFVSIKFTGVARWFLGKVQIGLLLIREEQWWWWVECSTSSSIQDLSFDLSEISILPPKLQLVRRNLALLSFTQESLLERPTAASNLPSTAACGAGGWWCWHQPNGYQLPGNEGQNGSIEINATILDKSLCNEQRHRYTENAPEHFVLRLVCLRCPLSTTQTIYDVITSDLCHTDLDTGCFGS